MQGAISDKLLINMKKLAFLTTLLFTGLISSNLRAVELENVTLQDLSGTGKSMLLNMGTLDDLEEGTYARFYVQRGPKEFPKIFLVAEGELIKTFPKKSYWYLRRIEMAGEIKRDSKLLMLTMEKVNSGRTLKMKSKTVVHSSEDYSDLQDFLNENKENVPNRLVKEGHNFEASPEISPKQIDSERPEPNVDLLLTKYEVYKTRSGTHYSEEYGDLTKENYFVDNQQVEIGDIKRAEDKKLFDSVNDNYVKKTNNMKYGLKGFYADQEKLKEMPDVDKNGTNASVYAEYKRQAEESDRISAKVPAKFKRDGAMWSADMDDDTLRRYFIQTGLEKEIKRRELSISELDGHELMFHYSNGMSTHGSAEDPNYQGRGYNFGLGYDLHLSRVSANWKKWSVQFILEKEQALYNTGAHNASSKEVAYGAYVNYYFFNNPTTLNSFIYLAGLGFKSASATIASAQLSKEYSYQVLTMPALQLMGKYRFRTGELTSETMNVGVSVNFGINVDIKNLSTNDELSDNINGKISVTDLKYTLGMSLYF
jgi:hypothetical protein